MSTSELRPRPAPVAVIEEREESTRALRWISTDPETRWTHLDAGMSLLAQPPTRHSFAPRTLPSPDDTDIAQAPSQLSRGWGVMTWVRGTDIESETCRNGSDSLHFQLKDLNATRTKSIAVAGANKAPTQQWSAGLPSAAHAPPAPP